MGPSTILSTEEEERISQWVVEVAKAGFPITKTALLDTVAKLIKEINRDTPFINGRPGRKWFQGFLRRHPTISLKSAEKLTGYRGLLTEAQIRNWFAEVFSYLEVNNYCDILEDGSRIFNADETAFALCPKTAKVLAPRGEKNVYDVSRTSEKENVTVLITVSGTGNLAPPMPVFPYKRLPADIVRAIPKGWGVGKSDSGWMTGEVFYEYMCNVFEPWLTEQEIPRPVLFFVDGHKSHLTMQLSNFLRATQIILVALHPNATHVLQPLDVAVFFPLKSKWKTHVRKWLMEHESERVSKQNMAEILADVIKESLTETMIRNGFRACGIFPFNPDNVNYSKCITKVNNNRQEVPNESYEKVPNRIREELINHKLFLESLIPVELLRQLQEHDASKDWSGEDSVTELYNVWKKLENMIQNSRGILEGHAGGLCDEIETQSPELADNEPHLNLSTETNGGNNAETFVTTNLQCSTTPSPKNYQDIPTTSRNTLSSCSENLYYMQQSTPIKIPDDILTTDQSTETTNASPFTKVLFWPKEKEDSRKRRVTEKVPSVVTSQLWQEYYEKKETKKEQKEREIQSRKRAREEKKAKGNEEEKRRNTARKPNCDKRKTNKKQNCDERVEWKCYKCEIFWKNQGFFEKKCKWLKCITCEHRAHNVCISTQHLQKIEMDTSGGEFLCDICNKKNESSDDEPFDEDDNTID